MIVAAEDTIVKLPISDDNLSDDTQAATVAVRRKVLDVNDDRTKSDTEPSTNWLYADGTRGWHSDPMLTVNTSLPSVCPAIKISLP